MTSTGLSIADLSARTIQLSREGVPSSEIRSIIFKLCVADGVSEEDAQQRVEQAYSIQTAIEAVLEPKARSSFVQEPATTLQLEPPQQLAILLAGLQS